MECKTMECRLLKHAEVGKVAQEQGLDCEVRRLNFVGEESAGKTTLMERFLGGGKVRGCNRCVS